MKWRSFMAGVCPFLFLMTACGGRSGAAVEKSVFTICNDTVYLHDPGSFAGKINVVNAGQDSVAREVVTAGIVQAIPTQLAYIAPPFAGRVTKSHVRLGQRVSALTPLFEIISPEFTSMQKEYFQAEAEREMAQKDMLRKEELLTAGVGSDREYEEALNALKQAEKEYENARAALLIYHADPDNMVLGEPLVVRAPIAGNIIDNNIVNGQYLTEDTEPVATIAELNCVWIAAQVKEKDIRFITEGDRMDIYVDALPGNPISGVVYHVDESVDEDTRSIKVLSECCNADEALKIGMYATVKFYGKNEHYAVLPEKAIMQSENDSYVLIKHAEDILRRQPVDVAFTSQGKAFIKTGLEGSEEVLGEGGYYFQ